MYVFEEQQINGLRVKIVDHPDPQNPRTEFDQISMIAGADGAGEYVQLDVDDLITKAADWWDGMGFGDKKTLFDICKKYLVAEHDAEPGTFVGLSMTVHGMVALHVDVEDGNQPDRWDSSFIGWAFATNDKITEQWGDDYNIVSIREVVVAEMETYASYLAGECYGYIIENYNGDLYDSCYGYYSDEDAMRDAKAAAECMEATDGFCDECGAMIPEPEDYMFEARKCPKDENHDPYGDGMMNGGDPVWGSISSGHYSHDIQVVDALGYLHIYQPEAHAEVRKQFPEQIVWEQPMRTHIDTEAMNVDPEWSSWLTDAIENTGFVTWIDGEPYAQFDVGDK